ncbi:MAG: UV DNA damage repair endonuclease UvsE [Peptostreptococcaceae bacterium]|nr:UV DNA damage repair endonuclease UvsE [Peptostreptococcaceae bacterium]
MNIGYACLTVGVKDTSMKRCNKKNASQSRLKELIADNLKSLENIIDYNIMNGIKLFRISSDFIPFGSSPVNSLKWWEIYDEEFLHIGNKIRDNNIRISMHPGQYTVLNSKDKSVVERAIDDLEYHSRVLDSLKAGPENKIVLHIGGVYNEKKSSIERFVENYHMLSNRVKRRLIIENDDKSYNISEVLEIGKRIGAPVVFDNLHNSSNPSDPLKTEKFWINECRPTWQEKDGNQKIHYSQQAKDKRQGAHSNSINVGDFLAFTASIERSDIDIMLEVKDKNLSAIKCINSISMDKKIKVLESEWSKYKYNVLEKSPSSYNKIRELLKNKQEYPAVQFYNILETAMEQSEDVGKAINAAMHVFGYFKKDSSESEKTKIMDKIQNYRDSKIPLRMLKGSLLKMAIKYNKNYLLESYYFILQ